MTTFERRQRILRLLRDQPGIKVTQLAPRLDVSEGTIRNDLSALEKAGRLTRVRGGAVLRNGHRFVSPSFCCPRSSQHCGQTADRPLGSRHGRRRRFGPPRL